MADIVTNEIGGVFVVAPTSSGALAKLANKRFAALNPADEPSLRLTRWIFADFARATLRDDWGNTYDHAVHTLLAGKLADGAAFIESLEAAGFSVIKESDMFVPLQRLSIDDATDSDELRTRHPRAWAIARRSRPQVTDLVARIRDVALLGT